MSDIAITFIIMFLIFILAFAFFKKYKKIRELFEGWVGVLIMMLIFSTFVYFIGVVSGIMQKNYLASLVSGIMFLLFVWTLNLCFKRDKRFILYSIISVWAYLLSTVIFVKIRYLGSIEIVEYVGLFAMSIFWMIYLNKSKFVKKIWKKKK